MAECYHILLSSFFLHLSLSLSSGSCSTLYWMSLCWSCSLNSTNSIPHKIAMATDHHHGDTSNGINHPPSLFPHPNFLLLRYKLFWAIYMSYNFHKEQIIVIILKYFACVILLPLAVSQLRPFKFKQNSTRVLNVSSACGVGQGQRSDVALVRGFGAGLLCLFQTTMSEILVVDLVRCLLQILQVSPGGEGVKNIYTKGIQ